MKSTVKKLEGAARQLVITLSPEKVNKALEEAVAGIRKEVTIPGFRKGNAPEDIVRRNYMETAMDEVKRRLVPRAYQDALDKHGVVPVSLPELSDVILEPNGALSFTARLDLRPEVKLHRYRGLKVAGQKLTVPGEEVEEALSRVRGMHAEFAGTDRPIQKGDYGICDIEAFIDGKPITRKQEKVWIEADRQASMLGLGEELYGMKKGEKKDMDVTLPGEYPDKQYAGKKAVFKVEVKETQEKKLPELDDALARKAGQDTLAGLREEMRARIMEKKEHNNRINMKNQIIEYLLKKHSFDLPGSMVKKQFEALMKRTRDELAEKGTDDKAVESHLDGLKQRLMDEARNKVKLYFILDGIAAAENISVTGEEVEERLRSMAEYYNQKFEDVKKYYEENGLTGGVKEQLREDKTLDFLFSEAVITTN